MGLKENGIAVYTPNDIDKAERNKAMEVLRRAKEYMKTRDVVRVKKANGYLEVERSIYEANKEKYDKLANESFMSVMY